MTSVSLVKHRVTEQSLTPPLTSELPGINWLALGNGPLDGHTENAVFQLKQSLGGCQEMQLESSQAGYNPLSLWLVWSMKSWTSFCNRLPSCSRAPHPHPPGWSAGLCLYSLPISSNFICLPLMTIQPQPVISCLRSQKDTHCFCCFSVRHGFGVRCT